MDHSVRISPDRRSEMGVELERKAVVTDVVGTVAGFRHSPEGEHLERHELRLLPCRIQ